METPKYANSCPECYQSYNLTLIPYELPCGHCFCGKCLNKVFEKTKELTCFIDHLSFHETPSELSIPFFYGRIVMECTELSKKFYVCSRHANEPVKFYCQMHQDYLCCMCVLEHSEHKNDIEVFTEENLFAEVRRFEGILQISLDKLQRFKDKLQLIKLRKTFNLEEIKKLFNEIKKVLPSKNKPSKNLQNEEKNPCENQPKENQVPKNLSSSLEKVMAPVFSDSNIIKTAPNSEFLPYLFNDSIAEARLLYRGSRDGFGSRDFHRLCDGKVATLVLIKSGEYYFGGFNPISWESSKEGDFNACEGSFLFSLNKKTMHQIMNNPLFAVYNCDDCGPTFGEQDLKIVSDCDKNTDSCAGLGGVYSSPFQDLERSRMHLAGEFFFRVEEIEVFQIFLKKIE